MIIDWNNKKTLVVEVSNFGVTHDIFKQGIRLELDLVQDSTDSNTTKYLVKWHESNEIKDLIINRNSEYYHLKSGYPKMVLVDNQVETYISFAEFRFTDFTDISRKYKINKILNS